MRRIRIAATGLATVLLLTSTVGANQSPAPPRSPPAQAALGTAADALAWLDVMASPVASASATPTDIGDLLPSAVEVGEALGLEVEALGIHRGVQDGPLVAIVVAVRTGATEQRMEAEQITEIVLARARGDR